MSILLVQGAGRGLGLAIAREALGRFNLVIATCRNPAAAEGLQRLRKAYPRALHVVQLDVGDESSIASAAAWLSAQDVEIDQLINCSGSLDDHQAPSATSLSPATTSAAERAVSVNAMGPLLMAKHFYALLPKYRRSIFASLPARDEGVSDNLGRGWYAHRGAKAAQTMFSRALCAEFARLRPHALCLTLHPRALATALSAPFPPGLAGREMFEPERSARQIFDVIDGARVTGSFRARDNSRIAW